MFVRDYMSTDLVTASPDGKVIEVLQPLLGGRYRHLPICDDGKLVGLMTQTDLLRRLAMREGGGDLGDEQRIDLLDDLANAPLSAAMVTELTTIAPADGVERAALLMRDHRIGCLPVVDEDGMLVGLLTETDVFDAMVDALGLRRGGARIAQPIASGEAPQTIRKLINDWADDGLYPIALAIYRPRNRKRGEADQHLVARLRGMEQAPQ